MKHSAATNKRVIEFAGLKLDTTERQLRRQNGESVQLSRRHFDALLCFIDHAGRLVDKRTLMDRVWRGVVVEDNTLSRTVSALRKQLGECAGENRFISTVPGIGYRFLPSIQIFESPEVVEAKPLPSIGVLAFADLSRERDHGHLSIGLGEELLHRLTHIEGIRVIAGYSSFKLNATPADVLQAKEGLRADYLVTGAVRKDKARLRINVQLSATASDEIVWSQQFDRQITDVFQVQQEIASAVAWALSEPLKIDPKLVARGDTTSLAAYDLYLQGLSFTYKSGGPPLLQAVDTFRKAILLDDSFAPAWCALAACYHALRIVLPERTAEFQAGLEEASNKATEYAPDSWRSHVAQSQLHSARGNWKEMSESLRMASELVPGSPFNLSVQWAVLNAQVGEIGRAIHWLRECVRSNPLSLMVSSFHQLVLHMAGREAEAEAEYLRSRDLPGDRDMVEHIAVLRAWTRGGEFRSELERYLTHQSLPVPVLSEIVDILDDSDTVIGKLLEACDSALYGDPMRQVILSWWLARYGEDEAAMTRIECAYLELNYTNVSFLWLPVFGPIRRNARFVEILDKRGLLHYWNSVDSWGEFCEPTAENGLACS